MTFRTLIRRSLRFHWRSHLGVVLGAAIGSAALIGALVVGDSVKHTLKYQAVRRLPGVSVALDAGDRFFSNDLMNRMLKLGRKVGKQNELIWSDGVGGFASVTGLRLDASVTKADGTARANRINLFGYADDILQHICTGQRQYDKPIQYFASEGYDSYLANHSLAGAEVWLNYSLAQQLNAKVGEELIFRIPKPTALSHDAAISPRDDATVSLRLRVAGISPDSGNFTGKRKDWLIDNIAIGVPPTELNLRSSVGPTLNAFVDITTLFEATDALTNKANFILASSAEVSRIPTMWDRYRSASLTAHNQRSLKPILNLNWIKSSNAWWGFSASPQQTLETVTPIFHSAFNLQDAQLSLVRFPIRGMVELKSSRIFLDPPAVRAAVAADTNAKPILTYLVNLFHAGTNATPYSMVTAADAPWTPTDMRDDEILISQWLADDLQVKPGDAIALTYFDPESGAQLTERTNLFRLHSITSPEWPWADRSLMPDFPGIKKAENTSEWDAGFPLTYKVRPKDDEYWKEHRGTPKAFVTLTAGQEMWGNRFGNLTAIRFPIQTNVAVTNYQAELEKKILANLKPEEFGLRFEPVREQALKAASESQNFGGLFLGFSFFLIIAALLLMAMLFQFGLEQRAPEIGTLLALGFTPKQVRKLLLREGVALAFIGGVIGAVGGIYFAKAMLHGLTTIWRDAVGATALQFYVTGQTLIIGIFASVVVSTITIWLALRKFVKRTPRELLVGETQTEKSQASRLKSKIIALAATVLALGLVGWTLRKGDTANAGAFFGAGALILIAGLSFASAWLARMEREAPASREGKKHAEPELRAPFTTLALAVRGCARRRKRSLATMAMLACGSFLIVSIGVFRLDANRDATQKTSGTGGFALIGETTLPVVQDLNAASGRDFFALNEVDLPGVNFVPFRVRAGDEASCLNLNRAQKPRLLGVKPEALARRFGFARGTDWKSLISTRLQPGVPAPSTQENRLSGFSTPQATTGLKPGANEIEIPAIGDANSIQWAMGKKVGDTIDYVDERGQPFKVRIVGAVANSILQGQLIIDEAEFVKRFPGESGYRMFLIDAPSNAVSQVSATLSRAMQDVGLELTPAATRLNQFNAVQNTYLGTFQVLGGLGLLLGSVGLGIVVLRNVLERRSELAVLLAVGFRKHQVQRLLLLENGALLLAGLAIGVIAAGIAVLPALLSPAAKVPMMSLVITLVAVLGNGAFWTWVATRFAVRGDLLAALRND